MDKQQLTPKTLYDTFYKKELSPKEYAEMKFNLVRYIELLIVLDKQHQAWLKQQDNNN